MQAVPIDQKSNWSVKQPLELRSVQDLICDLVHFGRLLRTAHGRLTMTFAHKINLSCELNVRMVAVDNIRNTARFQIQWKLQMSIAYMYRASNVRKYTHETSSNILRTARHIPGCGAVQLAGITPVFIMADQPASILTLQGSQ